MKHNKKQPHAKYRAEIMDELLDTPAIREETSRMRPETLEWYKELLVSQGIYARYVRERRVK